MITIPIEWKNKNCIDLLRKIKALFVLILIIPTIIPTESIGREFSLLSQIDTSIDAKAILEKAVEISKTIPDGEDKVETFQELALIYAKSGDLPKSQILFKEALKIVEREDLHIADVEKYREQNRRSLNLKKIRELQNIALAQNAVGLVEESLLTIHLATQMVEVLSTTDTARINYLGMIALTRMKMRNPDQATEIVQQTLKAIESYDGKNKTSTQLYLKIGFLLDIANLNITKGEISRADEYIDQSLEIVKGLQDEVDLRNVYRDIAITQARMGNQERALAILKKEISITPDTQPSSKYETVTHNLIDTLKVAEGLIEAGKKEESKDLILRGIDMLKGLPEDARSGEWRYIVQALAKLGDIPGALQAVKHVEDKDFAGGVYLESLVDAQIKIGDIKGALHTATIDDDGNLKGKIAIAQANNGDLKEALQTMETVKSGYYKKPYALRMVAEARVKKGDIQETLKWADRQGTPREIVFALLGVSDGLFKIKKSNSRNNWFPEYPDQHVPWPLILGLFYGVGRTFKEIKTGPDSKNIETDTTYDQITGQVKTVSLPYFVGGGNNGVTTYAYDVIVLTTSL